MNRERIEAVTADATYLRGLLAIPLGAVFIVTGLGNLQVGPFDHAWVFLICIAAAAAGWMLGNTYYNNHYGRVTAEPGPRMRTLLPYGLYGAALVGGPLLDRWLQPPVSLFAIVFAGAALSWYALRVQLRPYHFAVWGALLVAALVPIWGSFDDPISPAFMAIGVAVVLSGILDHWALMQRLPTAAFVEEAGNDRASA